MGGCASKPPPKSNPYAPRNQQSLPEFQTPDNQHSDQQPPLPSLSPFFPLYTPSPSRATPMRIFKFHPPSPAKHIRAVLRKRKSKKKPAKAEGDENVEEDEEEGEGVELDRRFGFSKELRSKLEVGEEVGRGHFGYTCSARFRKGDRKGQQVAVKVIPKSKMNTSIAVEDVRREVKILKALAGHSNLVQFYDAFEDSDNVYIVMELCTGGELLDRILSRGGKYPEDDAKAVMVQILNVVAFCHLQGVVHRDLKPENFLYTSKEENSHLKVIDFGLSDYVRPDERLNDIVGSAYYVAPEVLHRSYSTEADVWSIGVIALVKTLSADEIFYLKEQFTILQPNNDGTITLENIRMALMKNATEAMRDSRIPDILASVYDLTCALAIIIDLNTLQHRKMEFEEFCSAAVSVHQLEALDGWEHHARSAYELFDKDGNRAIIIQELASELGLGPSIPVHAVLNDWIRHTDGKLSFHGFVKLLHGISSRAMTKAP
ncbi:CDPK-related kinase 2 [Linum perenne]